MKLSASLVFYDRLDYSRGWDLQRRLVQERAADRCPDTLLLLEHPHVFTFGRSAQAHDCGEPEDHLRDLGFPVYQVERGGAATYHGPGQIVGYPILALRSFCSGPKAYIRCLEEVLIKVLAEWDIKGRRIEKFPGVWVGEDPPKKIGCVGVRITRGVTMHGFSLNVGVDLSPFDRIVPCGIPGCRVTSMAKLLGQPLDTAVVRSRIATLFSQVFGLTWIRSQDGQPPHSQRVSTRIRPTDPVGLRDGRCRDATPQIFEHLPSQKIEEELGSYE